MADHISPIQRDGTPTSQNPAEVNRAALQRVLPGAFTEAGLDLEALRELLGDPDLSREPGPGRRGTPRRTSSSRGTTWRR